MGEEHLLHEATRDARNRQHGAGSSRDPPLTLTHGLCRLPKGDHSTRQIKDGSSQSSGEHVKITVNEVSEDTDSALLLKCNSGTSNFQLAVTSLRSPCKPVTRQRCRSQPWGRFMGDSATPRVALFSPASSSKAAQNIQESQWIRKAHFQQKQNCAIVQKMGFHSAQAPPCT